MNGRKEYIVPIYDVDADEFREYIGFICTKPELIRCKDCVWRDEKTANCERFRKGWYVQALSYCSWAERRGEE